MKLKSCTIHHCMWILSLGDGPRVTVRSQLMVILLPCCCYLKDDIYPIFAFSVAPCPNHHTREQRIFNRLQEALRKDVKGLFGIPTARFHIMLHPCRY